MSDFYDYYYGNPSGNTWISTDGYKELMYSQPWVQQPKQLKAIMGELFFIYGTLKQGHRNHRLLIKEDFKLISDRVVIDNFALIEVANGVPGVVYKPGYQIIGQLYDMGKMNQKIMEAIEQQYTKKMTTLLSRDTVQKTYASIWVWDNPYKDNQVLKSAYEWTTYLEHQSLEYGLSK